MAASLVPKDQFAVHCLLYHNDGVTTKEAPAKIYQTCYGRFEVSAVFSPLVGGRVVAMVQSGLFIRHTLAYSSQPGSYLGRHATHDDPINGCVGDYLASKSKTT